MLLCSNRGPDVTNIPFSIALDQPLAATIASQLRNKRRDLSGRSRRREGLSEFGFSVGWFGGGSHALELALVQVGAG